MTETWTVGLHSSVRIMGGASTWLVEMLASGGRTDYEVLDALPYDSARSQTGTGRPNPKRYRDARQVVQTMGLAYEGPDSRLRVTNLGRATARWLPQMRVSNASALGRYAAHALSACTLRNPMRAHYSDQVTARPFAYLWRAMLALDDVIDSDELNRGLFHAVDEESLTDCIDRIRRYRQDSTSGALLAEVEAGVKKNDRIIPIVAAGSFGYAFIQDKRETGGRYYRLRPETRRVVESAARAEYPALHFHSTPAYVEHISDMAGLPQDVR